MRRCDLCKVSWEAGSGPYLEILDFGRDGFGQWAEFLRSRPEEDESFEWELTGRELYIRTSAYERVVTIETKLVGDTWVLRLSAPLVKESECTEFRGSLA